MKNRLSHLGNQGEARMVDISAKSVTLRQATAEGFVVMQKETLRLLAAGRGPKGEVLGVARIAGILAAKKCGELIPLCHPLGVEEVRIDFTLENPSKTKTARVKITATARIAAKTGVEMEALTAVALAGLTIIDMLKAVDQNMRLEAIRVTEKTGGENDFKAPK